MMDYQKFLNSCGSQTLLCFRETYYNNRGHGNPLPPPSLSSSSTALGLVIMAAAATFLVVLGADASSAATAAEGSKSSLWSLLLGRQQLKVWFVQIWPKSRGLGCVTSAPAADENRDAGFTRFRVDAHNIKAICVHNLGKDCSRFQHSTSLTLRLAGPGLLVLYCIVDGHRARQTSTHSGCDCCPDRRQKR